MSAVIKAGVLNDCHLIEEWVIGCTAHGRSEDEPPTPVEIAAAIVEDARVQARSIVEAARQEAESIRSEAFGSGYEAGLSRLDEAVASLECRAAEVESDVARQVEESWRELEGDMLRLALDIAGRVIRDEVSCNSDIVLRGIRDGLAQIRDRQEIRVHVNPSDFENVRARKEEITGLFDTLGSMEVVSDRRIGAGGCIIETPNGNLDARIDTQLSEIERVIMEEALDGAGQAGAETDTVL